MYPGLRPLDLYSSSKDLINIINNTNVMYKGMRDVAPYYSLRKLITKLLQI